MDNLQIPETAAEAAVTEEQSPAKRKTRRKMTSEQRDEIARKRAERKQKAENMKPEVYVQFEGAEALVDDLVEAAKSDFKKEKARTDILELKLYVKPEERAAYYVINGTYNGKINY